MLSLSSHVNPIDLQEIFEDSPISRARSRDLAVGCLFTAAIMTYSLVGVLIERRRHAFTSGSGVTLPV
jgi:hypothetical protein